MSCLTLIRTSPDIGTLRLGIPYQGNDPTLITIFFRKLGSGAWKLRHLATGRSPGKGQQQEASPYTVSPPKPFPWFHSTVQVELEGPPCPPASDLRQLVHSLVAIAYRRIA